VNPIAVYAESALREHPHPALRRSELVQLIAERVDRSLDEPRLRAVLEGHPDRFRILDPWRGPWRTATREDDGAGPHRNVWVVAVAEPGGPPHEPGGATLKLRESVRWLGRGIDPRSPSEVGRWYAIVLAERAARAAVARRAA
jgi:hypothetical protein